MPATSLTARPQRGARRGDGRGHRGCRWQEIVAVITRSSAERLASPSRLPRCSSGQLGHLLGGRGLDRPGQRGAPCWPPTGREALGEFPASGCVALRHQPPARISSKRETRSDEPGTSRRSPWTRFRGHLGGTVMATRPLRLSKQIMVGVLQLSRASILRATFVDCRPREPLGTPATALSPWSSWHLPALLHHRGLVAVGSCC